MNGVSDDSHLQTVYRSIKPKPSVTGEITCDSRPKSSSILHEKLTQGLDETSEQESGADMSDSQAGYNGVSATFVERTNNAENLTPKSVSLNATTEVVNAIASPVSSNFSNVVLLNSVAKNVAKGDVLKNSKVFVLNGSVLKEASDIDKGKTDGVNYICLTNNLGNIIKKIKCENIVKNGRPVISSSNTNISAEKPKILSTVPTFIQLSHSTLKTSNQKIAFSVSPTIISKPSGGNFEILRSKLLENTATSTSSPSVSAIGQSISAIDQHLPAVSDTTAKDVPLVQSKHGSGDKSSFVSSKKEQFPDSPAVAKARNELVRCRKALIEAAIHPQLPTYTPPASYSGPTYTCEECEDSFASTEGLSNHKNRRSVLFTYACPVCKKTLEFYNRCMFLLHVRSHDVAVKACFLTISVIPASKLNFPVLDDGLQIGAVDTSVPLESNCSSTSSVAEQSSSSVNDPPGVVPTSQSAQVVHIFRKRKSPSLVNEVVVDVEKEENLKNGPTETSNAGNGNADSTVSVLHDKAVKEGKSNDDNSTNIVGNVATCQSSNASNPVTIRTTKLKKKRLLSTLLTRPVIKSLDMDKSAATYTTTNSTHTTSTHSPAMTSNNVSPTNTVAENSVGSVKVAVGKLHPVVSKGLALPKSTLKNSGNPLEEIHLTSSDEEDVACSSTELEKSHPVACRECKQDVPNLINHYRATNRPMKEFPCEQCKFFNPSKCALSAHLRMHTRSVPFVCPDCGFYFSTIDSFLIHVKQVCFYDFKTICFKCPQCSILKPTVPQFIEHLKRCHVLEVFKCSACITSSYSKHVVKTHMEDVHPNVPPNVLEGFRCILCPNVLVAKQSIDVHIKKHACVEYLRYVYICKFCKKYASGHMSKFENHYHSCPKRINRSPSPSELNCAVKKTPAASAIAGKSSEEKEAADDQDIIEKDPLSIEEWEADKLKAEYVPKTKWCIMCRTTKLNAYSQSLFCNACVSYVNADGGTTNSISLADGVGGANTDNKMDTPGRSKRKFKCKQCKQLLSREWSTITEHYLQNHNADFDAGVSKSSKLLADKNIGGSGGGGSGSSNNNHSGTSTRKRKLSQLKQQEVPLVTALTSVTSSCSNSISSTPFIIATSTASTPNITPPKIPKVECKYRCVKCGFSTNVRNDFHTHIVSHKTQSNTNYQCLECGECFIVKPSLEKHLIVVHNVRDINEYYRENKIFNENNDDDDGDELKNKRVLTANQCEVCFMECNSKQQYDRHIRTHGMAFVAMQSRAKS